MDSPEYRASIGGKWYPGYNIQTAIGQGNLFTPIQLANYCAIIANGGTRYKLHFVKSVKSYDYKETFLENEPEILGKSGISKKSFDAVREGMLEFCTTGYGYKYFKDLPYRVAAKTGTAQAFRTVKGKTMKINNAFLVTYAPYDNPEIAICIVGEGCSSSTSIIPIAVEIYKHYFSNSDSVGEAPNEGALIS
jgi:penicillin-binding protein 2